CLRPRLDLARLDHEWSREIHQTSHDEGALVELQTFAVEIGGVSARDDAQVEVAGLLVAREDRSVGRVECATDSISEMLIEVVDGGDVLRAWSKIEKDLALVVRRGRVVTLDLRQQRTSSYDVNHDEQRD